MGDKRKKIIILLSIGIVGLIILLIIIIITSFKNIESPSAVQINIPKVTDTVKNSSTRTIRDVIEDSGSKYIKIERTVVTTIYLEFKNDLYDENGKSMKNYFKELIEELIPFIKEDFYLKDTSKGITIRVDYDSESDNYKFTINGLEDFYDKTDGEDYIKLQNAEIVNQGDFAITNPILVNLARKNMFYANTEYAEDTREELKNGYYSYNSGEMYAKLAGGRVLNTVFTRKYTGEISTGIKVGTKLEDIEKRFNNLAFGSSKEGYLGYRLRSYYVFIYDDQMSFYEYNYAPNEYFDKYLSDYCNTGNLQKLYEDFEIWSSYFEKEYDEEYGNFKISFPTRGLYIDIKHNDSLGIKVYNNYYLTDTIKELIKNKKITLVENKDLIQVTEKSRYESMR